MLYFFEEDNEIMSCILLVDDETQISSLLSVKLKMSGFAVFSTANGTEAIELARKIKPDLIVMDVKRPNFDGIQVYWAIRNFSNVSVVFMRSQLGASEKVRGIGARGFANKPFDIDKLIEKLRTTLYSPGSPYFTL